MTERELLKILDDNRSLIKAYLREMLLEIRLDRDLEHAEKLYKIAMQYDKKLAQDNEKED